MLLYLEPVCDVSCNHGTQEIFKHCYSFCHHRELTFAIFSHIIIVSQVLLHTKTRSKSLWRNCCSFWTQLNARVISSTVCNCLVKMRCWCWRIITTLFSDYLHVYVWYLYRFGQYLFHFTHIRWNSDLVCTYVCTYVCIFIMSIIRKNETSAMLGKKAKTLKHKW